MSIGFFTFPCKLGKWASCSQKCPKSQSRHPPDRFILRMKPKIRVSLSPPPKEPRWDSQNGRIAFHEEAESYTCVCFFSEGSPRDPRTPSVSFHQLAGPRCSLLRHRAAGLHTTGQVPQPAGRRAHSGALQVRAQTQVRFSRWTEVPDAARRWRRRRGQTNTASLKLVVFPVFTYVCTRSTIITSNWIWHRVVFCCYCVNWNYFCTLVHERLFVSV